MFDRSFDLAALSRGTAMETRKYRLRSRWTSNLVRLTFMTALLSTATEAGADVSAQCASSYENAQVFRKKGEYLAARKELSACMRNCSSDIQRQCNQWFAELDALVPSIIVHAEAGGEDRSDVRVEMDGRLLAETIDGKGMAIDPGQHEFTFTVSGYPPVKKHVILHDGEQLRVVRVAFEGPEPVSPSLPPAEVAPAVDVAAQPPVVRRPMPTLVYLLGGAGAIGGIGFAVLGLTANQERANLEETCSPNCSRDDASSLHTKLVLANVSLGVGLAALTAGAVVWLTRPSVAVAPERASFVVVPTAGGAAASATVRF
jgi:hypothetical protein